MELALKYSLPELFAQSYRAMGLVCAVLLGACGGGGTTDVDTTRSITSAVNQVGRDGSVPAAARVGDAVLAPPRLPPRIPPLIPDLSPERITRSDAARFLTQATFGPTEADINAVMTQGYSAWLDANMARPGASHRAHWEAANAAIQAVDPTQSAGQDAVWESFWKQAATGEDQVRQRMAFALSQIFVISALDGNIGNQPRAMAAWLDMLGQKGFTTYRELLESVALHPLMGLYLTHLRNQKADLTTGRIPDQNFARESMQLLSIGLVQLNPDGTPVLVNGKTVETYGPDDVAGLSRVFTGFSWACPGAPSNSCFNNGSTGGSNSTSDPDRYFKPMVGYPQFHSTEAKSFLGVTLPAQTTANPQASLKFALDTLAAHPNVGPFMSQQLIQRLVTSNPSPTYVRDVAAVFNNNGASVRGDLKAVLRAILLHPEARQLGNTRGKLREPVLRLSAYLRAFPHTSVSGNWKVGNTDSASTSLGQTPLRAPSVFNFYRPGYVAPGSQSAAAGLVAPELQLMNETSVAGWVNYMRDNLPNGIGQRAPSVNGVTQPRDLQRNWADELALTTTPAALTALVTDRLTNGQANDALRLEISTAVGRISIPVLNTAGTNQAAIDSAKRNRLWAALLLTMASPEFLNQK
jgi:uncharacterized protein (DUF1800 family)